jgi:hypothetical protein
VPHNVGVSNGTPVAQQVGLLDAVAFAAELAMLAGLVVGGWALGDSWPASLVLAVVLTVAVAAVWGRWCAPRAGHRLRRPLRWTVKSALVMATFLLLVLAGPRPEGPILAVLMLLAFALSLPTDRDA